MEYEDVYMYFKYVIFVDYGIKISEYSVNVFNYLYGWCFCINVGEVYDVIK